MVRINIMPLGMNFLVFVSRMANTTSNAAIMISAAACLKPGWKTVFKVVRIRSAAETAEVIRETLLPAFKNPMSPPTSNRMMYAHKTVFGFIFCRAM